MSIDPNSFPQQRFVISMIELYEQLKPYEHCFFFYPRGLAEAMQRAVQTYAHPYGADRYSAVLDDLDIYLDHLDNHNALPRTPAYIIEQVEHAVAQMDLGIYQHMNMHFGEREFYIAEAKPLVPQPSFVVSVVFDLPSMFEGL